MDPNIALMTVTREVDLAMLHSSNQTVIDIEYQKRFSCKTDLEIFATMKSFKTMSRSNIHVFVTTIEIVLKSSTQCQNALENVT